MRADDVPLHYPPVDEQLANEYPELRHQWDHAADWCSSCHADRRRVVIGELSRLCPPGFQYDF